MIPNKKSSVFYHIPELGKTGSAAAIERFNFEKGETRRRQHSAARPKVSGKTALFPRNDRPYGLKCEAFQTENALKKRGAPRQRRASVGRGGKHRHGNSGVSRWKVYERRKSERFRDQGSNPGAPVLPCAARLSGSHPNDRTIFSLKCFLFQTICPVVPRKKSCFSA